MGDEELSNLVNEASDGIKTLKSSLTAALERAEKAEAERDEALEVVADMESTRDALKARVKALEVALRPFAGLKRVFAGKTPDDAPHMPDSHAYNLVWNMDNGRCDLTLGQFRRARAALEG